MIIVNSYKDVISTYIYEGLRRLWSVSVDENNEFANFDYAYNTCDIQNGVHMINYEDIYCSQETYNKVINQLLHEQYRVGNGRAHNLKKREKDSIQISISMGPSPWCYEKTFAERHPNYKIKNKEMTN